MSRGLHTVVLDARSSEKYRERHVRGAVNLSFPDITVESLRRLIPHTQTRIAVAGTLSGFLVPTSSAHERERIEQTARGARLSSGAEFAAAGSQ